MRVVTYFLFFVVLAFSATAQNKVVDIKNVITTLESKKVLLPNGWTLTPAGRSLEVGDLPLNMAVSSTKKLMAVTNNGQGIQTVQLIDTKTEKVLDNIVIPKSFYGIKFSKDEKQLYVSGGNDNWIMQYAIINSKLILKDSIVLGKAWPVKISPAGIEIDNNKNVLYVVTKENNSLYIIDLITKNIKQVINLGNECYACVLSDDKKSLYISIWGGKKIAIFNTETNSVSNLIDVSYNPNELLLSKNGKFLFVANAGDNSVSIINTATKKVVEILDAALYPQSPVGSVTNGLALSEDEKTLYIANADNNFLSVFDVSVLGKSKSKGFIPVGWYPTNVKVIGHRIFVTNGKGFSSFANPLGPQPVNKGVKSATHAGEAKTEGSRLQYIGSLMKGTLSIIDEPNQKTQEVYTKFVYKNTPYKKQNLLTTEGEIGNPIPMKVGAPSPIKYVFYILKENRTYDQVFGDIAEGNGDSSLCLFGEKITPNQHKLAKEYVLLDNFYVDAEVSADGHNWTMGGYATDYLEKTWPSSYSNRGGTYGGEGEREIANNKNGFLWNQCNRYGVSYRTYGEFVSTNNPTIPILKNHFCTKYPSYDLGITDAYRFQLWKKDFDSLLAINKVPQFNTVRFGNDHTEGLRLGRPTPYAHVADNDYAVGLFIEALSKSSIWNETAVFILEDDAQNGSDHVDAHRSTAYVAGGFVKRNFVDHTPYSTSSMLRTMELILGIPPMTQYDAAAMPLWRSFDTTPKPFVFSAITPKINTNTRNTARNEWQQKSEQFNFAVEDAVNDFEFNKVLWHGLKGNVPFPAPRRAAFVTPTDND